MDVSPGVTSVGVIGQKQMVGGVGGKLGVCRRRKGVDFVRGGRPWSGQSNELGWVGQVGFAVTLGCSGQYERACSSDVIALESDVNARQRVAAQVAARREGLRLDRRPDSLARVCPVLLTSVIWSTTVKTAESPYMGRVPGFRSRTVCRCSIGAVAGEWWSWAGNACHTEAAA